MPYPFEQLTVNGSNNVEVANSLQNLTSQPETLSSTDVSLSADTIEKIVNTTENPLEVSHVSPTDFTFTKNRRS